MHWYSIVLALVSVLLAPARADEPISIGSRKQLFFDDLLIASANGVRLTMNKPVKDQAPVFEDERATWSLYPSVLQDGDIIRFYYTPRFTKMKLAYAESKDGLHWVKPTLGLMEIDGSKENNVLFPATDAPAGSWLQLEGGGVFIDKNPACPPAEKYKMAIPWGGPSGKESGTWVIGSPDGIHWKPISDKKSFRHSDTGNVFFWDENLKRYAAFARVWSPSRTDPSRRKVVRCEFDDPRDWGKETVVFEPDMGDPRLQVDFYTNATTLYEGVYLMFPSVHAATRDYVFSLEDKARLAPGKKYIGAWDVQLAVSRDGIHWTRPDRSPFVPIGTYDAWDSAMIGMATGLVKTQSEIYMYYWGRNYPHLEQAVLPSRPMRQAFGRLRLRLDGFVSADAAYAGGELTTLPVVFIGKKLVLNFETGVGGSVKVQALDRWGAPIPEFTLEKNDELYGNFIRREVTWEGSPDVSSLAGRPVRLRFVVRDAKLYSFQFVD